MRQNFHTIAAVLCLGLASPAQDLPDVDTADPDAPAIRRVMKSGLMVPDEGKFRGSILVNRYMMAGVIARYLALSGLRAPSPDKAAAKFEDVPEDHPNRADIAWCVHAGALQGYDGKFHGDKLINGYQMAVIVKKVLEAAGQAPDVPRPEPVFSDVAKTHWSYESLQLVASMGLIQGFEDGKFCGDQLVDRARLAGILFRTADKFIWKGVPEPGAAPSADLAQRVNELEKRLAEANSEIVSLKARLLKLEKVCDGLVK